MVKEEPLLSQSECRPSSVATLRSPTLLPVTPHPRSTSNVVHLVSARDLPVTLGLPFTARLMSLSETLRQSH